jgi:hypothetical protein
VDQRIVQRSRLGQLVRDMPVDDGLGVSCSQLAQNVSMSLLVAMQGGFHTVP